MSLGYLKQPVPLCAILVYQTWRNAQEPKHGWISQVAFVHCSFGWKWQTLHSTVAIGDVDNGYVMCQTWRLSETFKKNMTSYMAYLGQVTSKNCHVHSNMCDFFQQQKQSEASTSLFNVFFGGMMLTYIHILLYIHGEKGEWAFQALRPLLWDLQSCARIKFDHFEAGSRFERSERSLSHGSFRAPTYRQMMSYGGIIRAKD